MVRYDPGHFAPKHQDSGKGEFLYRKVTSLLFLSDYESHGLVGGGTSLIKYFSVIPKRGRVVVFRSKEYHCGVPVFEGQKYAFVFFMGNEDREIDIEASYA